MKISVRSNKRPKIKFLLVREFICPISFSRRWLTRYKKRQKFRPAVYFSLARIFHHASWNIRFLVSTISCTILSMFIAYHRTRLFVISKFRGWQNTDDKNARITNACYIVYVYIYLCVRIRVPRVQKHYQMAFKVCRAFD